MIIEPTPVGFRVTVPCKINLFLEVLGKRDDGYHSLDTVMMAVSLVDELEITHREDSQLKLSIEFPNGFGQPLDAEDPAWRIPADQNNLVIRALDRLRQALAKPDVGANVRLIKRIPAMAGLGGGSADAAAAMIAGLLLWTSEASFDQVCEIASELGSDINFFLQSHCNGFWLARCTGRGEKIEPLGLKSPLHWVVIHPPRGCGTKEVFGNLRLTEDRTRNPQWLIEALHQGSISAIGGEVFNRLEGAAIITSEWVGRSIRWIDRYDHHGQAMSGSGSARFCLCATQSEAEKIVRDVLTRGEMRAYYAPSWQAPGINEQIARIRNNA